MKKAGAGGARGPAKPNLAAAIRSRISGPHCASLSLAISSSRTSEWLERKPTAEFQRPNPPLSFKNEIGPMQVAFIDRGEG